MTREETMEGEPFIFDGDRFNIAEFPPGTLFEEVEHDIHGGYQKTGWSACLEGYAPLRFTAGYEGKLYHTEDGISFHSVDMVLEQLKDLVEGDDFYDLLITLPVSAGSDEDLTSADSASVIKAQEEEIQGLHREVDALSDLVFALSERDDIPEEEKSLDEIIDELRGELEVADLTIRRQARALETLRDLISSLDPMSGLHR